MRLNVCIASRGRANALVAVIMCMWRLRSGQNDINFIVGVDRDDDASILAAGSLVVDRLPVRVSIGARPETLGAINNRLIADAQADAYVVTTDRAFLLAPGWDEQIRVDLAAHPGRVLWLSSPQDHDPTHPVLPASYIRAVGQWSPEIFPFWFDDTWNAEIEYLAYGNIIKIPVQFAGERGRTTNAREIPFWSDVFDALRHRRVKQASRLRHIKPDDLTQRINYLDELHRANKHGAERNEARFGDDSPPSHLYLAAKARAERLLKGATQ